MNIVTVITRTAGGEIKKVPGRINFDDIESMSANTYELKEKQFWNIMTRQQKIINEKEI